jgi:hypothetical protein
MTDDLRNIRSRLGASSDDLDRLSDVPPLGSARMVGRVFAKATLPTTNAVYYAVHPVDVGGTESEGSSGVLSADTTRTCYFLVLGTKAPAVGDDLIARSIGGRWVAWRGGASSGSGIVTMPASCQCHTGPATIQLTITGSQAGWFLPIFHDDTFDWTVGYLGVTGLNVYVGRVSRTDSPRGTSATYHYVVSCPAPRGPLSWRARIGAECSESVARSIADASARS